jgi:signal peptidase I
LTDTRRRPWLAGLLSLVVPGLGQLYGGRPQRAAALFLVAMLLDLALIALAVGLSLPWGLGLAVPLLALLAVRILWIPNDASSWARKFRKAYELRSVNRWYVYLAAGGLGLVVPVALTPRVVVPASMMGLKNYNVPTGAMSPAILPGDFILVDRSAYRAVTPFSGQPWVRPRVPARGDVVAFRYPEDPSRDFVKRVIGLPGETVEIKGRVVTVNGTALTEPYARFRFEDDDESFSDGMRDVLRNGSWVVPPEHIFVLGDDRDNSKDSRFWGPVPIEDLRGRVLFVYWSREVSREERDDGSLPAVSIRWKRIGHRVR